MPPNVELLQQKQLDMFAAPTGLIDAKDIGTPDAHVSRDPMLTRLTGKHPLNAECPLPLLMDNGFITPNSLHVVRNHGPVPKNDFDSHRIEIGGLVNKPCTITMQDLLNMTPVTIPVTIPCAGNRRKEQNMIRPTIGFSWGPGGVGTAYWTGVFLRDVINQFAGGLKPEALHICMEGNDATAKGGYGTSIPAQRCMDPEYDIMIAYKMNGEALPYDHGYPVRCIVPGCIGGRSVKWLTKIEATLDVSQNPYQNADNKVFPPTVLTSEQATEENWWTNPLYSVYDLNVNAAIATPYHGTQVPLDDLKKTVTLSGYAYGGSNREVTRCEITFDDGKTWTLAKITDLKPEGDKFAQDHFGYNPSQFTSYYSQSRFWTWKHWSLEVPVSDLLGVKEICLRCWNNANSCMPKDLNWSLMGMLNNCWYRVRVHLIREPTLALVFQHPTTLPDDSTLVGNTLPGWMEEAEVAQAAAEAAAKKDEPKAAATTDLKTYTMDEVAKHTTEEDCWLVYNGLVYDVTPFLTEHPGGASSIILAAGGDCTEEFDAIHSQKARDMFEKYLIGKLADSDSAKDKTEEKPAEIIKKEAEPAPAPKPALSSDEPPKPFFEPRTWKKLVLQKREILAPTIRKFTFGFPKDEDSNQTLAIPIGKHVYMKLPEDMSDVSAKPKMVMRAYTPSKVNSDTIEFVIKIYFPFNSRPGGKLTSSLEQVRIGESVDFKGPIGEIEYLGDYNFEISNKPYKAKQIGMIAGGTGITPMWQIIQAAFDQATSERPQISLIYCARSMDEIIFHPELNHLQQQYGPDQFRVRFILNESPKPEEHWNGGIGMLTQEEMHANLFPFDTTGTMDGKIVFLCGPDPMLKFACYPLLEEEYGPDYVQNSVFKF